MASECRVCSKPVSRTSKLRLCRVCSPKHRFSVEAPPPKHCTDCGKELSFANSIGRCKGCFAKQQWMNPEFKERRMAGIWRKINSDPDYREGMRKRAQRLGQITALDPEIQAKRREAGKRAYVKLNSPEVRAKNLAAVKAAGWKHRERMLAWCPERYRDLHRWHLRTKHMTLAESQAIILPMVADDEALKHIDSALYFLNRLAPTAKLENGYRYGNAILRPSEVIERAKLRGWQPDRWAA